VLTVLNTTIYTAVNQCTVTIRVQYKSQYTYIHKYLKSTAIFIFHIIIIFLFPSVLPVLFIRVTSRLLRDKLPETILMMTIIIIIIINIIIIKSTNNQNHTVSNQHRVCPALKYTIMYIS